MDGNQILYFDEKTEMLQHLKSYIVNQCLDVCRNEISQNYVRQTFKNFDFGYLAATEVVSSERYIRSLKRAQTGIKNFNRKREYTVYSFAICKYIRENNKINSINIQVLCNSKNNTNKNDAKKMLSLIEDKARSQNIGLITLNALGKNALRAWYEKQGFKTETIIGDHEEKYFYMTKEVKLLD